MIRSALCLALLLSSISGPAPAAETRHKSGSPRHHHHHGTPAKRPSAPAAPSALPPASAAPSTPEAPPPPPIGEIRTEVAAIADALTSLQQDVRGLVERAASESTQAKLQAAGQLRQVTLLNAQVEALANRVEAVDRDRRLDQTVLERRIGGQEEHGQALERRLAALAAERTAAPAFTAMGLALIGILAGAAGIGIALRVRHQAVEAAEAAADRLFRIHRLEFAAAMAGSSGNLTGEDAQPRSAEPVLREPQPFAARFPIA